jgi:YD repeat-containing protein
LLFPQYQRAVITYNGLYRLTQEGSTGAPTTTFQYAYDPVGNRTARKATITSTQVTNYAYWSQVKAESSPWLDCRLPFVAAFLPPAN